MGGGAGGGELLVPITCNCLRCRAAPVHYQKSSTPLADLNKTGFRDGGGLQVHHRKNNDAKCSMTRNEQSFVKKRCR